MSNEDDNARTLLLLLRSLFWTLLVPGSVVLVVPWLIVSRWQPAEISDRLIVQLPSAVMIVVGLTVLLHSIWNFAIAGRGTLSPVDAPRRLVVTGLYRYMRNPMYAGVLLFILGEALLYRSYMLAGYAAGVFLLFNLFVIFYEEKALHKTFGSSYERYRRNVRRWLPGRGGG